MVETNIYNTMSAFYIGLLVSAILFGITTLQVYVYYTHYPKDHRYNKFAVALAYALDTIILLLNVHAVYYYLIVNFGNPFALLDLVWSMKWHLVATSFLVPIVQTLYACRIYVLRRQDRVLPIAIFVLVIAGYAVVGITITDILHQNTLAETNRTIVHADFSYSAILDNVISATLCFYLYRSRSSILNAGMLTSACSVEILFTYIAMPNNMVFLAVNAIFAKLYVNSFLAMLNARQSLRDERPITLDNSRSSQSAIRNPQSAILL